MTQLARGLAVVLLGVLLGCAPGRMADLRDSGRMSLGVGLGLSADVKIGDLTHPSLGLLGVAAMYGWESRHIEGRFLEARISEPYATYWFKQRGFGWADALNDSGFRGAFEIHGYEVAVEAIKSGADDDPPEDLGVVWAGEVLRGRLYAGRWLPIPGRADDASPLFAFDSATDLQVGATLLLLQARVGFNPLEFTDFLLGFFGLDIAGDDEQAEPPGGEAQY